MRFANPPLMARLSAMCAGLILAGSAVQANDAAKKTGAAYPKGQYAALDKLPDWGGVWTLNRARGGGPPRERPALKGKYLQEYQAWQKAVEENNGVVPRVGNNCRPPGMPGIMSVGQYPIEFMFTPGRVTIHHEAWMQWRIIYTDGRPHPPADEWDPTFYGHSTGKWEGDTLVVDTIGVKETVPLGQGMNHSDKIRITERMQLAKDDPDTLVVDITVEDPLALEKPWRNTLTFKRSREWELIEFICAENDRNPVNEEGFTQFE
jgi:hypothetical protein